MPTNVAGGPPHNPPLERILHSLLLAVCVAVTYFFPSSLTGSLADRRLTVGASAGRISFTSTHYLGPDLAAHPPFNCSAHFAGFGIIHVRSSTISIGGGEMIEGSPSRFNAPPSVAVLSRGMTLPAWLACLCFAVYPFVCSTRAARQLRQNWRSARGCCAACSYDLRATRERCPECGHLPHNPPMQRTATDQAAR